MSKSIYKYDFQTNDTVVIEMPKGAVILSLQVQRERPCLWAFVQPGVANESRWFRIFGTGHSIPANFEGKFLGTYQLQGGALVFHVFEIEAPAS